MLNLFICHNIFPSNFPPRQLQLMPLLLSRRNFRQLPQQHDPAVFPGRQYHFNPPLSASVDFSHGVKSRARSADVSIPPHQYSHGLPISLAFESRGSLDHELSDDGRENDTARRRRRTFHHLPSRRTVVN